MLKSLCLHHCLGGKKQRGQQNTNYNTLVEVMKTKEEELQVDTTNKTLNL